MYHGVLKKMLTEESNPIQYFLELKPGFIHLNQCLNRVLEWEVMGTECLKCSATDPIFAQGFCRSCFFENPAAGEWIIRPELSKAHLNEEDRDLNYEKKIQLQPHVVYLALSSHIKVGVTRKSQLPTRWIDQGARQGITILEVPNRYLAGIAEVSLKSIFSDKTQWRKMVQNKLETIDWATEIHRALAQLPEEVKPYIVQPVEMPKNIFYPMEGQYPLKPTSLNLSKNPSYSGKLIGIKGQYLLFEDQTVFNVRSNEGQVVKLKIKPKA